MPFAIGTLLRKKGQVLGRVDAPDGATAIEEGIRMFGVDEAHRSRLIATPIE